MSGGSRSQYPRYREAMEAKRGTYPEHLRAANEAKRTPITEVDGISGKECRQCLTWKPLDQYGKEKAAPEGIARRCKECTRARGLNGYHRNAAAINAKRRTEEFRAKWRAYHAEWARNERASNVNYRLARALRFRVWRALKGLRKEAPTLELLGCTLEELRAYLESKFRDGMSWENYGQPGWEIDHIRPCASFDLSDIEQLRQCFHYSNLQPLWGVENWAKGHRY